MSVLGGAEILARLESEQIFRLGTWLPDCVQEASYELRVAGDFLLVGGKAYLEDKPFSDPYICIQPGEIALLSTIEQCNFPPDLVGRLGIKFRFTLQGLTPLFRFQVNPLYGSGVPDERLYLRVFKPIYIKPEDRVFNIEFHSVEGAIPDKILEDILRRGPMKQQIEDELFKTDQVQYPGFIDVVQRRVERHVSDLEARVETVEHGTLTVVLFGVFIVAASIIGVALSILLQVFVRDSAESKVESAWAIAVLIGALVLVVILAIALAGIGFYFLRRLFKK